METGPTASQPRGLGQIASGRGMAVTETTATRASEVPEVKGGAMEITVGKTDLLNELTATQGVVERKTTIPILSNFLF